MANIKEFFGSIFHQRFIVVGIVMTVLSAILIGRLFYLQIINGDNYQENYALQLQKEMTIEGTRGNIYDRYGNLLAYNTLSYSVIFEDEGVYDTNAELNDALFQIIEMVEENGDSIATNNFGLQYKNGTLSYNVSGTKLSRFLADVYGHSYVSELTYNKDLGYDESVATPEQLFEYLCGSDKYNVSDTYTTEEALKIVILRYAMSANSYQKYISTVVAENVSDKTVAKIEENKYKITGLDVEETTIRAYNSSKYFAQLIGYTGKISSDEYESLSKEDESYTLTDEVGKSGIEKSMESTLRGASGYESLYVDSVGNVLQITDYTEPSTGNDVYLTLDMDLQITIYNLLEQELGGILSSMMVNTLYESEKSSEHMLAGDVYFALLDNNVIDIDHFSDDDATDLEQEVYAMYLSRKESVISEVMSQLSSSTPTAVKDCDYQMQDYEIQLMSLLYSNGIIDQSAVDTTSDEYNSWKNEECSLEEYLRYCISCNNINTEGFVLEDKYADLNEIYDALVVYLEDLMQTDTTFTKLIYEHLIQEGTLSGRSVCLLLYDQGILDFSDADYEKLSSGSMTAYSFMKEKLKNLDITAAQLALDPCNASCVVVDPNSGQVLACVTYPGYDNNLFANSVDADYYTQLSNDQSNPLLNYATQQRTAPGSTFKMVTAAAALTEGLITPETQIKDEGVFDKVDLNPKCWIYPSNHGLINVSEAIRDSCNYFFYEMGYEMSTTSGEYNDSEGIDTLTKYAEEFGLGANTGIEISEAEPKISDEDAVRSAIGQGTHNYTTTELARYVAAVGNEGTVYDLSLILKTVDPEGNTLTSFSSTIYNQITDISQSSWDAIHLGMEEMINNTTYFDLFKDAGIQVAGKTGTAQEQTNRPDHALFVGFAPSTDPTVALAVRIPFGYGSGNTTEVASSILKYYFDLEDYDTLSQSTVGAENSSIGD